MAALGIVLLHVFRFEAPGRAEAVGEVPARAELAAAVEPAAVEQDALTHLYYDSYGRYSIIAGEAKEVRWSGLAVA